MHSLSTQLVLSHTSNVWYAHSSKYTVKNVSALKDGVASQLLKLLLSIWLDTKSNLLGARGG